MLSDMIQELKQTIKEAQTLRKAGQPYKAEQDKAVRIVKELEILGMDLYTIKTILKEV